MLGCFFLLQVSERIERRREKGLEILEKPPPRKKKSNIEIDKDRLREAIGGKGTASPDRQTSSDAAPDAGTSVGESSQPNESPHLIKDISGGEDKAVK